MSRIYLAVKASPRKAAALLGTVAVTGAVVAGSNASFTSTSANPGTSLAAGTLSHLNSKANAAILTASGLLPGESRNGTVDITNNGDAAGTFSLSQSTVVDTPASPAFSAKLNLVVEDCGAPAGGCAAATSVYSGKLGSLGTVALGRYAANESHRYRFTIAFPDGGTPTGPTTGDNAYQAAASSVRFDWQSVGS